jgi:hypothetical protein
VDVEINPHGEMSVLPRTGVVTLTDIGVDRQTGPAHPGVETHGSDVYLLLSVTGRVRDISLLPAVIGRARDVGLPLPAGIHRGRDVYLLPGVIGHARDVDLLLPTGIDRGRVNSPSPAINWKLGVDVLHKTPGIKQTPGPEETLSTGQTPGLKQALGPKQTPVVEQPLDLELIVDASMSIETNTDLLARRVHNKTNGAISCLRLLSPEIARLPHLSVHSKQADVVMR